MQKMKTLYEKYGGTPTVTKIVKAFYQIVLDRPNLARYFVNIDMDKLIRHQIDFVCSLLGKPSQDDYDMEQFKMAHKKFKITNRSFDDVAHIFVTVLHNYGVSDEDIENISENLEGLRDFIVGQN